MQQLPLDAEEIHIEWRIDGGGIGVLAFTDEAGLPYIGLYPLNWNGEAIGLPFRFQRRRLMADVVAGFEGRKPVLAFLDAEVTAHGLDLRVSMPYRMAAQGQYPRLLSAKWGSPPPHYRLMAFPANSNWLYGPVTRD